MQNAILVLSMLVPHCYLNSFLGCYCSQRTIAVLMMFLWQHSYQLTNFPFTAKFEKSIYLFTLVSKVFFHLKYYFILSVGNLLGRAFEMPRNLHGAAFFPSVTLKVCFLDSMFCVLWPLSANLRKHRYAIVEQCYTKCLNVTRFSRIRCMYISNFFIKSR